MEQFRDSSLILASNVFAYAAAVSNLKERIFSSIVGEGGAAPDNFFEFDLTVNGSESGELVADVYNNTELSLSTMVTIFTSWRVWEVIAIWVGTVIAGLRILKGAF